MPEWSSVNAAFAREGSKQLVACSETLVPPTSEPSPICHSGASSLSSEEEEEAAPSLSASKEDLRCGKGLCVDVEKDSELSELEPPASPATPPGQPWGAEEEVVEDGEDRFAFRKPNGECHGSEVNNGLLAVIRCFQVVSPAPHTPGQLGSGSPNIAVSRCHASQRICACLA